MTKEQEQHPTTQYALAVVNGEYGQKYCGELEKLACKRHLDDLQRQGTEEFPYVFDPTRANRIIDWYGKVCCHVRGVFSGQHIKMESWQKFDHGCLYGWVHKDTGARRFNISFNLRARGNVKSTENSCDCNFAMCADAMYPPGHPEISTFENEPEVSCAAVDKDQAKRVWGDARAMGIASPAISKRLDIRKNTITHKTRGGWMRALSKDLNNKDSGAETYISIDEYHKWPTSEIKDTLFSGFGKRQQSLMSIISTAGLDAENNPCRIEQRTCEKILRGEIVAENYFVMIRTMDVGDDPHDEKNWYKPNPILRINDAYSKSLYKQIKMEHELAFGSQDYTKMREWLTKRANMWQETAENKYMANCMDEFKKSAVSREEFAELVRGHNAYYGLDIAKKIDLTGDAFAVPLEDGRIAISGYGYMPEETVSRHEQTDRVPYRMWANDGWLTITPGAVTDYEALKKHMRDAAKGRQLTVKEICYDPWSATQYAQEMEEEGYTCVEIRQGYATLSEPTKTFREYVMTGKIVTDGSPLMEWCFANAYEDEDSNGNIKISKKNKDDTQRIDVAAAVLDAFVRALLHPVEIDKSAAILSDDWSL